MFSTCSSECECTGTFGMGPDLQNILGNPFCPAGRQPLIYYAKIQEPFLQQNYQKRKDNSNYFMKAFRWYTQERRSGHGNESHVSNSDFAAWLDEKYNEYLKGHQKPSNHISKVSSKLEVDGITKKKKSKGNFGRMRSPWRRNHQPKSKESNLNQSLQYILQPQNLSGTLSECCPRTSRMQSTTTIISKASPKATKVEVKSKSLLSIYRAKDQQDTRQCPKSKAKNVLCECLKTNAGTQYETYSLETFATPYNKRSQEPQGKYTSRCNSRCIETITADVTKKIPSRSNIFCQCNHLIPEETDFNRSYKEKQTLGKEMSVQPTSEMPKPNVMFTDNTNKTSPLQNLSAQTSDHSVNLGQILNEHPLLLRVVHVSK